MYFQIMSRCPDVQLWRYEDMKIWRYEDIQISRYPDIQISRNPDIQISSVRYQVLHQKIHKSQSGLREGRGCTDFGGKVGGNPAKSFGDRQNLHLDVPIWHQHFGRNGQSQSRHTPVHLYHQMQQFPAANMLVLKYSPDFAISEARTPKPQNP